MAEIIDFRTAVDKLHSPKQAARQSEPANPGAIYVPKRPNPDTPRTRVIPEGLMRHWYIWCLAHELTGGVAAIGKQRVGYCDTSRWFCESLQDVMHKFPPTEEQKDRFRGWFNSPFVEPSK